VRIVAIYFVCASAWIIGTDIMLTESRVSGGEASFIQSLKGLNFVITTAVLLYLVLRRAYGGWRLAEQRRLAVIERASEKFRNLSSRIQTLQEEERTRISREIHDQLGQLLTGIKMELRLVENRIANIDDRALNGAIDKLVEISEMVDDTIESVQRISTGLRPSALDNLGLGTALMDESVQFRERSGVPCSIVIESLPDDLPQEVATVAFRIFQECLTNIARHANAGRVDAVVKVTGGSLRLSVSDDGGGIDPEAIEDPHSLGLIGMRERAETAGGLVVVQRNPVRGTNVILTIPLPPAADPTESPS
jgi:signal transduction histidine kinase